MGHAKSSQTPHSLHMNACSVPTAVSTPPPKARITRCVSKPWPMLWRGQRSVQ